MNPGTFFNAPHGGELILALFCVKLLHNLFVVGSPSFRLGRCASSQWGACCQSRGLLGRMLESCCCQTRQHRVIERGFYPYLWHPTHILIPSRNFQLSRLRWISHTICLYLVHLSFPSDLILCFLYPVYFHIHPSFLDIYLTSPPLSSPSPQCVITEIMISSFGLLTYLYRRNVSSLI